MSTKTIVSMLGWPVSTVELALQALGHKTRVVRGHSFKRHEGVYTLVRDTLGYCVCISWPLESGTLIESVRKGVTDET